MILHPFVNLHINRVGKSNQLLLCITPSESDTAIYLKSKRLKLLLLKYGYILRWYGKLINKLLWRIML